MVVAKADGSTLTLRVLGVSQEPNGEEITTVSYEREEEHKVFPGYVMVKAAVFEDPETGEMEMTDDTWYVIRNTRGVTGFVGPESKPIPLSEEEVLAMGVEKRVIKLDYNVGDMVKIIDGVYADFFATVREIDIENKIVTVALPMMHTEATAELEFDQVEKVEED
jgi:transcriptional antiterminator NusG